MDRLIKSDLKNIYAMTKKFQEAGLYEFFDRMLYLLQELLQEVTNTSESPSNDENSDLDWGARLRVHMLGSSIRQFAFASTHLFKGQALEVYGHMRRAIEGAGIAYLSKSDSNAVELYRTRDEWEFSNQYPTRILFPRNHLLTRDLNRMLKEAARKLHSNLYSIDDVVSESAIADDDWAYHEFTFTLHEGLDFNRTRPISIYIFSAAYYVARLHAASFDFQGSEWSMQLERYKTDLDQAAR